MHEAIKAANPERTRRPASLVHGRIDLVEFKRQGWFIRPEAGHTLEQVLHPSYWAQVASRFKLGDRIEFMSEDHALIGELIVTQLSVGAAVVEPVFILRAPQPASEESNEESGEVGTSDYSIKFGNEKTRWRVIDKNTKMEIKTGLPDRDAAKKWLADHLATKS